MIVRTQRHCPWEIFAWPTQIISNKPSPAILPLHLCINWVIMSYESSEFWVLVLKKRKRLVVICQKIGDEIYLSQTYHFSKIPPTNCSFTFILHSFSNVIVHTQARRVFCAHHTVQWVYILYIKKITLGGHRYWSLLIGQIRVPQPTTVYFYRQSWADSETFFTYSIDKEFIDRHCRSSVVDLVDKKSFLLSNSSL